MDRKWLLENFPPQKQLLHLGAEFHSISKYFTAFKKSRWATSSIGPKTLNAPLSVYYTLGFLGFQKMSSDDAKKYATGVPYLKLRFPILWKIPTKFSLQGVLDYRDD